MYLTLIFLPEPAVQAFRLPLVADSGQRSTFVGLCLMPEGLLHSAKKITLFTYKVATSLCFYLHNQYKSEVKPPHFMQNQFSWIQIELKTNPKQQEFNSLRETKSNTLLTSIAPRKLCLSCNQAGFTCIMFWRRLGETHVDESVPWVLIGQKRSWQPRNAINPGFESLWKRRAAANSGMDKSKRVLTFLKVFSFSCTLLWKSEKILWSSSTDPGCRTWIRKMIWDLRMSISLFTSSPPSGICVKLIITTYPPYPLPHPPPTFFALITVIKFERKIRQYRDSKQKRTEFHCCHDNSAILTIANKILTIAHKCQ